MVEERVRILSGSYSASKNGLKVELYVKNDKGESITLIYRGFRPYFYIVRPTHGIVDELRQDPEIKRLEDAKLWVDGDLKHCKKVVCTHPWEVPKYRNKYVKNRTVLAADIPFVQRFIYDLDLSSTVKAEGVEVDSNDYTTNRVIEVKKLSRAEPLNPKLKYLSFDLENSLEDNTIFTICCRVYEGVDTTDMCISGDELEIIREFQQFVRDEDPDVITGYNINGYDLPLLDERARFLGLNGLRLGRDGTEIREASKRFWRITGRIVADAWWCVRRELSLKRETLNHVAKVLLGEEKNDVNPLEMDSEWKEDPEKVMEYCLKDADLALKILLDIGSIEKAMDMATVSKLPLDEGLNGRTSTLVDSILIREADRHGIGIPLTSRGGKRGKIKGGYVHSIEPGLYHWVSVLDFKSMYPSIIIENNICFTTLSSQGEIKSPTKGVNFLSPDVKKGLLPSILRDLMRERDEVKEKMKNSQGNERSYYKGLQDAIKILMNSFYGVFASSFYRFTDDRIGEAITAFARENIKRVINNLEEEGLQVIYSDTDSVFFRSPAEDVEKTVEFTKRIADEYTKGDVVLEFEKVLDPFFSHGRKKRYVGQVVWPNEEMLVRGYEVRRSDSFEAQNESLEEVFKHIMNDDIEGAIETAKTWIERVRSKDIATEKLVISRTCKDYSYYVNPDSMPNVQAARKMEKLGYKFTPGMKVSWIVTDGKNTPQKVEPWLPDGEMKEEPDWDYYARRIASTLSRVTDVFGWDKKGLMAGNKQSNLLSDMFNEREEKDDKKEKKKTVKKMTLHDFV